MRRGDVAAVHSLRRGAAEALELVAHGDRATSKIVGRKIEEIELPRGVTIGAVVRETGQHRLIHRENTPVMIPEREVIIAHHDTVIESEDHVIVFCVSKKQVAKVEKLFQVGFGFF